MGWKKCYLISGIAGVILGFNLQVEMIFSVANTTAHELELKFYRGQPDALKLLLCIGSRKDQIIKVYCTRAVSLISAWGCSRGLNLWPLSHIATTLPATPRLPFPTCLFVNSKQAGRSTIRWGCCKISCSLLQTLTKCASRCSKYASSLSFKA